MNFNDIKDILLIIAPILVAYLSYRSNKKSKKEIMNELNARLQEKDKDTANEIQKMSMELENQKQLSSWINSQPQTDEYLNKIDITRRGNVMNLPTLTNSIFFYLESPNMTIEKLKNLKSMVSKIKVPNIEEELFPYEIPIMFEFENALSSLKKKIAELEGGETNA